MEERDVPVATPIAAEWTSTSELRRRGGGGGKEVVLGKRGCRRLCRCPWDDAGARKLNRRPLLSITRFEGRCESMKSNSCLTKSCSSGTPHDLGEEGEERNRYGNTLTRRTKAGLLPEQSERQV
jgi:hypothetical protein